MQFIYKSLYEVAMKIFCIPASSAPTQRIFSQAHNILCDNRIKNVKEILQLSTHLKKSHVDAKLIN